MSVITGISDRQLVDNILDVYAMANNSDREGRNWYRVANAECVRLANTYNVPVQIAAAVVAVLSPRLFWERNIDAAESILDGRAPAGAFKKNIVKAWAILQSGQIDGNLRGSKVNSFYSNMTCPDTSTAVTVDTWAIRIASGDWQFNGTFTKAVYDTVARAYAIAAEEIGLLPSELQAITWVTIKRLAPVGRRQLSLDI